MDNKNKVQSSFIEMSRFVKIDPIEKETPRGWVMFGESNMYPEYLIELYNNCSLHNAVINSTSDMIKGQGLNSDPSTLMEIERLGFNKELPMISLDLKLHGGVFLEVLWSINHERIAKVNHLPTESMRLAIDEFGEVCGGYFSRDWADIRKKRNIPSFIPLFNKSKKGEENRELIYIKRQTPASRIYHAPDYIGGVNWVELSRQISEYHLNQLLNGFFPSLIASFNNGIPTLEEQGLVKQNLQNTIMGTENAGKVLVFFNEEKDRGVEFTPFPITDADKQYQFLSEESTTQIFMAHRITSPLLFGVRDGGGLGSNKEEMQQALFIYQKQVVEPYQRMIINMVNDVIEVNGFKNKAITIEANELFMDSQSNVQPTAQSLKKKDSHVCCSSDGFTDEQGAVWVGKLKEKGEVIDLEEWQLLSEEEVTDYEKEEAIASQHQSLSDYANPDEKSKWGDVGLYKLRYAYSTNLSQNSRPFCIDMVALSKGGVVFKYEDIQVMGDDGVNGQFAPEGLSTYNIFKWKGGAFCHHFWKRQIYFRKREKGKFLPNKGLENDTRVGNNPYVPKKGEESVAPINTPSRGSIKYS